MCLREEGDECGVDEGCASASDALVSCCGCQGTIAHVHIGCLRQWQRLLWEQGLFSRAARCDVCLQPYTCGVQLRVCDMQLPLWQRAQHYVQQLQRSPELALRAWRWCILLGGLVRPACVGGVTPAVRALLQLAVSVARRAPLTLLPACPTTPTQAAGTQRGLSGLGAGLNLGVHLARPLAALTLRLLPQASVAAAVAPSLTPVLQRALRASCCVMLAELVLPSAAGLFGGGLVGFALGSVGMMRLSGCAVASMATRVASAASALGGSALPRALLVALLRSAKGQQVLSTVVLLARRRWRAHKAAVSVL
jgi:hypothetical protein